MMNNEFNVFLSFVLIGLIIGFLFDFFRILRRSYKTPDVVTIIEDIIFWITSGILILLGIFVLNEGKIRAYLFLGLIAGIFLYIAVISKYVMKIGLKIFNVFNKILIIPLQKATKILINLVIKLIKILIKFFKKIKIDLFLDKNNKKRRKYKSFVE